MTGGWISLYCAERGLEALRKAPRTGYTKTIVTAHLQTCPRGQACGRSDGRPQFASETTTTTALRIFFSRISGRTRFTATTATALSPTSPKRLGCGTSKQGLALAARSLITTAMDTWTFSFPTTFVFHLKMR